MFVLGCFMFTMSQSVSSFIVCLMLSELCLLNDFAAAFNIVLELLCRMRLPLNSKGVAVDGKRADRGTAVIAFARVM